MTQLHILVVVDAETGAMTIEDMSSAPVDSDQAAWDEDEETWRTLEPDELGILIKAEDRLRLLLDRAGLRGDRVHRIDCDLGEDCSCVLGEEEA